MIKWLKIYEYFKKLRPVIGQYNNNANKIQNILTSFLMAYDICKEPQSFLNITCSHINLCINFYINN